MHDVVVTAYGLVSPLGSSVEEFEQRMFNGDSGVINIRGNFVAANFPVPYCALIENHKLPESQLYKGVNKDNLLKSWMMTAVAAEQTLKMVPAGTAIDAVVFGTADGVSFEFALETLKRNAQGDHTSAWIPEKTCSHSSLNVINQVMAQQGFKPVSDRELISINGACASGNQAIGLAYQGLRAGRWQRCLVGGVDARCEASNLLNFNSLGALITEECAPEKASRPFSKDRGGFVRGEGAAVLMLETREAAEARGATILGQVSGYGLTSDAYRLTDGREDGASVIEAMEQALRTAGLEKEDIQYINAHGTATPLNDRLETLAIKKVFGDLAYKIPVSSLKSQIGHSTIASSAIEAVACMIMLQRQKVSPTINYNEVDPECDLDYVPGKSREVQMDHVLSNSFAFGGQNACVVFSREKKA